MTYPYSRLNLSRIRAKVADIRENVDVLKSYAAQEEDTFPANKEALRSAKYAFIVMSEASCNNANHLCAKLLNVSPDSYAECFLVLGNNDLLTKDLSQQLGKMAGFRNLLVHGYAEVDDKKIFAIMQNNLGDIERWLNELDQILSKKTRSGDRNDRKKRHTLTREKKRELFNIIKETLQANPHILFAFVHGSFLENDLPFADIDIAISLDESGIIDDEIDLCLDLSLQLSALVGKKVDIHALNRCKLGFCFEATRGVLLFAKDEDACFDFVEKTRLQYFDYKHLFAENLKDLMETS